MTCYIALSDVTPNRGRVEYVGTDEAAARESVDGAGRVYTEHPASVETPEIGARAYHDGTHAWTTCGYSEDA